MATVLPFEEAKTQLAELVRRVSGQHERVTVTLEGRPSVVLVASEDLDALEETLAILSDPELMRRLAASEAELVAGEVESASDLAAAMAHRGRGIVA